MSIAFFPQLFPFLGDIVVRKRSVVMTLRGGLDRHGCGHLAFSDDEREWIDESQWQSEVIVVSEPDSPEPGPTVPPDSSQV